MEVFQINGNMSKTLTLVFKINNNFQNIKNVCLSVCHLILWLAPRVIT